MNIGCEGCEVLHCVKFGSFFFDMWKQAFE